MRTDWLLQQKCLVRSSLNAGLEREFADGDATRGVQVHGIERLHGPAGGLQQAVDLGFGDADNSAIIEAYRRKPDSE